MALSILARLRLGRYDAAALRPSAAEWPPHPARVFSALVASATDSADWSALQWLESAGEPEVWASPMSEVHETLAAGYVVTNVVGRGGGNQTYPGRTNGYKQRVGALPADHQFALVWPDADPDDATLGRLVRLARRVPYLGRSTSSAELTILPEAARMRSSWTPYRPAELGAPGAIELRVPYRGYADALQKGYDEGQRSWEFGRGVAYVPAPAAEPESADSSDPATPGPYRELLVWGLAPARVPIAGDRLFAVTETLRRAVISRVREPVPSAVSGHGADGRPHIAYLALPHVGAKHADGHLLGIALAIPADLSSDDRRRLLRAVLDPYDPLSTLRLPWRRNLSLDYQPERTSPWGAVPDRWTGGSAGARSWVSVTPVMMDRYPHRRDRVDDLVRTSFAVAGYPEPVLVELTPSSPVRGGVHLPRRGTFPDGYPRRPLVHCRVEFAAPLIGPVFTGSLRYLGLGLFAPEHARNGSLDAERN